ncbi:hypothetical protein [Flavobacterium sp.]|uniref:hypothetical protein n=1 Tax=Flavobacterium sp. TaxID=239 RepID=UPI0039E21A51
MSQIKLLFLILLTSTVFAQTNLQKKVYPKTYQEAIEKVIKISDEQTKNLLRDCPKYNVGEFDYIIHDNNLIDYTDSQFLTSCAKSTGVKFVHYEDVTNVILAGVWDQLNSDLELIDFEKVEPENYFNSILTIINKGEGNRLGYLSSLPYWVYHADYYYQNNNDSIRNAKILNAAKKMVLEKNQTSYLGLRYISQFDPDLEEKTNLIQSYYENENDFFKIPSYHYIYSQKKLTKENDDVIGINYVFKKISYKDFSLKCYEIIYNKTFNTSNDYETFLEYCNNNYLAKWKFLKTLSSEDYKILINEPRKLLEILILTQKYFYRNSSYDQLIQGSRGSSGDLINYIESQQKIDHTYPYSQRLLGKFDYRDNEDSNREVNALKIVVNQLSMEEIFDILNPNSIKIYNQTLKTEDFLEHKYLISFILASQYKRFLNYPDKKRVFENYYYYWTNEHVSWPFEYFVTDMLIQIDRKKANEIFKKEFQKNPTKGSFTRQGILSSIIEYDFSNNSKFVEDWYWTVQDKDFNYSPAEHKLILELLKDKNNDTLSLYNKITNDIRYRE